MARGPKTDANPRQPKKPRLPQFRTARSQNTAQRSATDTSSVLSLQQSHCRKLTTQERECHCTASMHEETPPPELPMPEEIPSPPQVETLPLLPLASTKACPKLKQKHVNTTQVGVFPVVPLTIFLTIHLPQSGLQEWLNLWNSCLDEILCHDGPVDTSFECGTCSMNNALFRCKDCGHGCTMFCDRCIIEKHMELELHQVEKWNGSFFEKAPLCNLGLRIQLGHDGGQCPLPVLGPQNFIVFDLSGAHQVNVNFCGC
ncbi:hypothetical protein CVT25_004566 [Psilocybe cyanescens]|uniref:CxC2-like cysteine cluster KDZ transposase-associated domain-containing protein n=1 Tax=Psilocybe cyanescens TaxID=93625 RepID=A0A409W344_PSICY|nr:hypothetical protein CVT25_004566 [Psilocybe cyanescens]